MWHEINLVGRVGRDAEMRYTPNGNAVTTFSVAVNREYTKGDGEKVKETLWIRTTVWGKMAEVCNMYVKKGMLVLVSGTLSADKSTGAPKIWSKTDGTPATSFEVNASTVKFLSRVASEALVGSQGENDDSEIAEDDFPF
jgi:single-strand DNA-binding protein